jgi:threonine dehydratase
MSKHESSLPDLGALEAAAASVHRVFQTPQYCWPLLSERCGAEIWVKHENHTPTGAFKVRGGLVYMEHLREAEPKTRGVISATTGNHGQSLAFAARRAGLLPVIVAPEGNSPDKNAAMRAFGAELIEHGSDFEAAVEHARELSRERGLHFVVSYHPWLVQGVGTYSLELLRAVPELDMVYVPIGLGSGICGMMAARDALGLKTRIVGVISEKANCYALSFEQRRPVSTNSSDTFAGGLAVREPNEEALEVILKGVERIVAVSDEALFAAMGHYFTDSHNVAEGAGAAALAAALSERDAIAGKKVGVILSGGNIDAALYTKALESV